MTFNLPKKVKQPLYGANCHLDECHVAEWRGARFDFIKVRSNKAYKGANKRYCIDSANAYSGSLGKIAKNRGVTGHRHLRQYAICN